MDRLGLFDQLRAVFGRGTPDPPDAWKLAASSENDWRYLLSGVATISKDELDEWEQLSRAAAVRRLHQNWGLALGTFSSRNS